MSRRSETSISSWQGINGILCDSCSSSPRTSAALYSYRIKAGNLIYSRLLIHRAKAFLIRWLMYNTGGLFTRLLRIKERPVKKTVEVWGSPQTPDSWTIEASTKGCSHKEDQTTCAHSCVCNIKGYSPAGQIHFETRNRLGVRHTLCTRVVIHPSIRS